MKNKRPQTFAFQEIQIYYIGISMNRKKICYVCEVSNAKKHSPESKRKYKQ